MELSQNWVHTKLHRTLWITGNKVGTGYSLGHKIQKLMRYFWNANKKNNKHPYLCSHSFFPELSPWVLGLGMSLSTDVSTCKPTASPPHHTWIFSHLPLLMCPSPVPALTAPHPLMHPGAWQSDCRCWPPLLIAHSPPHPWGHLVPGILPLTALSCLGPPVCCFPSLLPDATSEVLSFFPVSTSRADTFIYYCIPRI